MYMFVNEENRDKFAGWVRKTFPEFAVELTSEYIPVLANLNKVETSS